MWAKNAIPSEGFVRLRDIIAPHGPLPIGKSSWWAGVKDGRFPRPVKIGPRITAWRASDIRELIARLSASR
jgi:predicted DNA-binding transcriptional regulator AlpA